MNPTSNPFAELFAKLATSEMSLQSFTEVYPSEDESIEYKTVPKKSDGWGEKVRNVFSEAAVAMANTNGGLIIWGVACEQQKRGKGLPPRDRVTELCGVIDADTLIDRLKAVEATVSDPPILGIRHTKVEDKFVVSFIPRSSHGPHQSRAAQGKYLMRVGGRSEPMPHRMVADAILAKKSPDFELWVDSTCFVAKHNQGYVLEFKLSLVNTSPVTAEDVYVILFSDDNNVKISGSRGVSQHYYHRSDNRGSLKLSEPMHSTFHYPFGIRSYFDTNMNLMKRSLALQILVCGTHFAALFCCKLEPRYEEGDSILLPTCDPKVLRAFVRSGELPSSTSCYVVKIDASNVSTDPNGIFR